MGYTYEQLEKGDRSRLGYHMTSIEKSVRGDYALRYYNGDLVTWRGPKVIVITYQYRSNSYKMRMNAVLPWGMLVSYEAPNKWVLRVGEKKYVMPDKDGVVRIVKGKNGTNVYGVKSHTKWWAKAGPAIRDRRNAQAKLRYWRTERDIALGRITTTMPKTHNLTVKGIMAEPNTTIRMAKVNIFGIDKFMAEANAQVVNAEAGYELTRINIGQVTDWRGVAQPQVIQALRMACPSTGQTYIETVPPTVTTVREALDWRYDTTGYLDRIGLQT